MSLALGGANALVSSFASAAPPSPAATPDWPGGLRVSPQRPWVAPGLSLAAPGLPGHADRFLGGAEQGL